MALVPVELREAAVQVKAANAEAIAHCDAVIAGRAPAEITVFGEDGSKTYRFYVTSPPTPSATVIQFPKRRTAAARQRERRSRSGRSSARSGDSGSDSDPEPPAADRWRWASSESWRSFVESVGRRDFEAEVALERWNGVAR